MKILKGIVAFFKAFFFLFKLIAEYYRLKKTEPQLTRKKRIARAYILLVIKELSKKRTGNFKTEIVQPEHKNFI